MRCRKPLVLALAVALGAPLADVHASALWRDAAVPPGDATAAAMRPSTYRSVSLDADELRRAARGATGVASDTLELPLPDGGTTVFRLAPSDVLPADLAAKYPRLRSLKGVDDSGRRARIDLGPDGVHALVRDAAGDWMLRPDAPGGATARGGGRSHIVFRRADAPSQAWTESEPDGAPLARPDARRTGRSASEGTPVLRTFRLAMTATSAYTKKMGGTVEDGLAGVVRTANRLNDIYENELGVHFVLADGSDRLVFVREEDDPFARIAPTGTASDSAIVRLNVTVARDTLGEDGFDVGHVLDARRNAGLAGQLGNTCMPWTGNPLRANASKAAGMTGSLHPFGDAFHVDYVAHELGHQFGAHHTFNGCDGRDPTSAFAPGSGSTIMGYAGICGKHDLQAHSDPYFHAASLEQIRTWLDDLGGHCAATRPSTSPVPVLDTNGWEAPMIVPAHTPFRLRGAALFAAPDARLTYTFEQMDHGEEQPITAGVMDVADGPLFRSRLPQASGEQTFPSMNALLGDEPIGLGDAFPRSDRNLRFRLTARDNMDHRSHVVAADRRVKVVNTGTAFAVTAPVEGGIVRRGRARQVRWEVAETDTYPIACPRVDIFLSTDGGRTFAEEPLARRVANNGRAAVIVSQDTVPTRDARIRVDCADGRFFALSGSLQIR